MPAPLHLSLTDFKDETRWRWVLSDERGNFLADHEVHLEGRTGEVEYNLFTDLPRWLKFYPEPPATLLHRLGEWMGEHVFGGLRGALRDHLSDPATVVQVSVPEAAQALLFRPFEQAHLDGQTFAEAGIRLVYTLAGGKAGGNKAAGNTLRVLAVFSLPHGASPLNLRRERHTLKRGLDELRAGGAAIELRVLQYGATRATLREALRDGAGWDILHFSGHGLAGELALETDSGAVDIIQAGQLLDLLRPTRGRLKLLMLSACLSGAGSVASARVALGLDAAPGDAQWAEPSEAASEAAEQPARTALPSLAQQLAGALDCAALAMRYPVGDEFAIHLAWELYESLLAQSQPLPAALQIALDDALERTRLASPLSRGTPILFGPRAADLVLVPPPVPPDAALPTRTLAAYFPPEPETFVGRLQPMLQASQALAPRSPQRGVLFFGMAGAGKTSCALELAYRHEQGRFVGHVWWKAPDEKPNNEAEVAAALGNFLHAVEVQLGLDDRTLTIHLTDPDKFRERTLPQLRALLSRSALLLVADNIESLLTEAGGWRDALWGDLVAALLDHRGTSRLMLTSRRVPATLERHPALLRLPIHALSLAESVLLARELPHLGPLFESDEGRATLQRTLAVVQGHPKLLDLADRLAADGSLDHQLVAQSPVSNLQSPNLQAFFTRGETEQQPDDFVATLQGWTRALAATLSPTARLLLAFLARLEEEDRLGGIVEIVWPHLLGRLALTPERLALTPTPLPKQQGEGLTANFVEVAAAQGEPGNGLATALDALIGSSLVESVSPLPTSGEGPGVRAFRLHSAIAETARADAAPDVLAAVDVELGNFWKAVFMQGIRTEMQSGGPLVVQGARRAAPYLLRAERWEEAGTLLERLIQRDSTPATLAFALPLLHLIAEATQGTELGIGVQGILANTLLKAGRHDEAEQTLRELVDQSVAQGNYRIASTAAGDLLNLLWATGRLDEALALAGQKAEYTRRAGLGRWTQLGDEGRRLQILATLGRYDEVLARVDELRPELAALPERGEAEEAANPWNVREALLNTVLTAAIRSGQWQTALDLNAEIVAYQRGRGADALEVARTGFNDYSPLLRLRRFPQARTLLNECRAVFEQEHAPKELGAVFSALADLEDKEGHPATATRFEADALRYRYQVGEPEDCAISHNNLAGYLKRSGAAPGAVLAHRLAACVIDLQTGSSGLELDIRNLALSPLPATPPTFAEVVTTVEQIEGVHFAALFARLPRRAPNGDAAIAAVWQLAQQAKVQSANPHQS